MDTGPKIAQVASLVGDPARANMLALLMDGRLIDALTASELACVSGVSPQTASGHLAKLRDAGLIALEQAGTAPVFSARLSACSSRMLEGIMVVAQDGPARHRDHWRGGDALRTARTCYDHMAGRVAVGIACSLVERSHVTLDEDGGKATEAGHVFLEGCGIRLFPRRPGAGSSAGPVWTGARGVLTWPVIVGAALLDDALARGWCVQRVRDSRILSNHARRQGGARRDIRLRGRRPTRGAVSRVPSCWATSNVMYMSLPPCGDTRHFRSACCPRL